MMGKLLCFRCRHFLEEAPLGSGELGKCEAFPNGIPYEVFSCVNRWDPPKNCNNGIGFEPDEQITK